MKSLPAAPFLILLCACSDQELGVFNGEPSAEITSHGDGAEVLEDDLVALRGAVSDPDNDNEDLLVTWLVDGGVVCASQAPQTDGSCSCEVSLSPDSAEIALEVRDPEGAAGDDHITLQVIATEAPEARILDPEDGGIYYSDNKLSFEGLVSDAEDEASTLTVWWESDEDGELTDVEAVPDEDGVVTGFGYLSEGEHALTLTAEDSSGKTGWDSLLITVGPPNSEPSCAITAPQDDSSGELGSEVTFTGQVDDVDVPEDLLEVTWSSDEDGELGSSTPTSEGEVTLLHSDLSAGSHVISMTVMDELGATCTDAIVYSVGTAPQVSIDAPTSGDLFNEDESVGFSATVSDEQDAATSLALSWESSLDGVISNQGADSAGQASFSLAGLTAGDHQLTLTVTDPDGLWAQDGVDFTINGLPSAPVISISPDPATTEDDLNAVIDSDAEDPEGDAIGYSYAWYQDGALSGASSSALLPSSATASGQTWTARITPDDGHGNGDYGEASITISNTAPSITSASLSPSSPYTDDTISANSSTSDVDGDSVSLSYAWYVDKTLVSEAGSSLDGATWFDKHQTVFAVLTPDDGSAAGSAYTTAAVTVLNTPPEVPTVAISPSAPMESDDLLCEVTADSPDDDGDSCTYSVTWTQDGVAYTGASTTTWSGDTVSSSATSAGEVWQCTVTPDDGDDVGTSASDSVTVTSDCASYADANEAYWAEALVWSDMCVGGIAYTWDSTQLVYTRVDSTGTTWVLIPDLASTEVDAASFYGYGQGGSRSSSDFQYDDQQLVSGSVFDVDKLIVSPFTSTLMALSTMMNTDYGSGSNTTEIFEPLVYSGTSVGAGVYDVYNFAGFINDGVNFHAHEDLHVQQSLESSKSWCVAQYGLGWRLPTSLEVGNDVYDRGYGTIHDGFDYPDYPNTWVLSGINSSALNDLNGYSSNYLWTYVAGATAGSGSYSYSSWSESYSGSRDFYWRCVFAGQRTGSGVY